MTLRDPFGGAPLLTPRFGSPEAPATGTPFADAIRSAERYLQTQGRIMGMQVHRELGFDEVLDPDQRRIYTEDYAAIARVRKRLPAHARLIRASATYQVYLDAGQGDTACLVYHRLSITDGSDTDIGPEVVGADQVAGWYNLTAIADDAVLHASSGVQNFARLGFRPVFGPYDLEYYTADCFCEVIEIDLDAGDEIIVTLEAYAVRADAISAFSDDSSRTSDVVRLDDLPSGHGFHTGDLIWTEGFDENVPQGAPVPITNRGVNFIEFTLEGPDDGDLGDGTVYRATGLPVYYRPAGAIAMWWEA